MGVPPSCLQRALHPPRDSEIPPATPALLSPPPHPVRHPADPALLIGLDRTSFTKLAGGLTLHGDNPDEMGSRVVTERASKRLLFWLYCGD